MREAPPGRRLASGCIFMRNFGPEPRGGDLFVLVSAGAIKLQMKVARLCQVQQPRAREEACELSQAVRCQECTLPLCRRPDDQEVASDHADDRRR